jgi:hypothetical protein
MAIPNVRDIIDGDWAYVDLTVSAVVTQPDGSFYTVDNAVRFNRAFDWASVGGGELPSGTVTFGLWVDQCASRPRLTARVVSGGVNYRVFAVQDVAAASRYDVACVPEV